VNIRRFASIGAAAGLACAAVTLAGVLGAVEPIDLLGGQHARSPQILSSTSAQSLAAVRWLHQQVTLQDGRVLVVGGRPGAAASTAEIFDPKDGTWKTTAPMLFGHDWPIAARMCDGSVIVAVGGGPGGQEAEIYNPTLDTWTDAGAMKYSHIYGTATLLADCRVLIAGGYSANTHAEVYRPDTGTFASVGTMHDERFFHTVTALPDGRAIAAGGGVDAFGTWYTKSSVDMFDPGTGKWTAVQHMHGVRRAHTATLLPDGRLLVAGGTNGGKADGNEGGNQLSSSEIYDVGADTWEAIATPLVTPRTYHTAALMPGGAVLLFGGLDGTASATSSVEGFFEGAWRPLPPLLVDRYLHGSALLDDGTVLVTGGLHQATTERYALTEPGGACGSNVECAAGHCVGGLCCNDACDTGCRRCDVPGKEGTCVHPCADATHALVCPAGAASCPNEACIQDACGEYRCAATKGACLAKCKSVDDCAPGYACSTEHECVAPPDVSATDADGCNVAAAGRSRTVSDYDAVPPVAVARALPADSPPSSSRSIGVGVGVTALLAVAALVRRRRRLAPRR
jgi:hypothetical protein